MKNLGKPLILIVLILSIIGFESCHDLKKKADLIIYNAKIYAPDSIVTGVNCIAVKKGIIIAVGTDADIRSRFWAPENINASGATVYPGFTDAHSHFTGFAQGLRYADLTQANSFDEVIEILQGYRKLHPDGWIVGRGWDQNNWPGKSFPDNKLLNKLFPGVPVVLTRIDGHAVLASEAAIKSAGITMPVKKDEAFIKNGEFTGIFLEEMADKLRSTIPLSSIHEMTDLLVTATRLCHEAGLTSVTDAGLNKSEILLLDSLQKAGKITLRIDAWLSPTEKNFDYFLKDTVYQTPFLRVGAIKMYADGALGSRGACLLSPYLDDPQNQGILVTSPDALAAVCKRAYEHGFQVNTHAIGDSAVRMVLHTYAKFLKPGDNRRWRIEHAQVVNENDFALFAKYHIIPSVQATHATSDMDWAGHRLGYVRLKNAYAYNRLLKQNGWLPNGTDFPVESIDPVKTFYAAVARKDADGEPTEGFFMENALSRINALKSMTIWAAKACFEESRRGSIEVGKAADFTILNTDIIKAPEAKLLMTKVLYTIVDGKIVYKAR
ncbi:MAG: amidohydrolase [Bacteroidales bacterium]|nr:amidohydrolase [Bacteroidales bacterium]